MAGLTRAQCEAILEKWRLAMEAVAEGQSYSMGGRSFTLADVNSISTQIEIWESRVKAFARSGMDVKKVVPQQ